MSRVWTSVRANPFGYTALATSLLYITFGLPSQALRIWHNQSAGDVSISMYLFLCVNATAWLAYGFRKQDWFLIVPNTLSLLLGVAIVGMCLLFGAR